MSRAFIRLGDTMQPALEDYERYAQTLVGFHVVAFACLLPKRAAEFML